MLEGALQKLAAARGTPATYQLCVAPVASGEPDASRGRTAAPVQCVSLNAWLGHQVRIDYVGSISCCYCGRETRKSYAQGFCYPCFRKLARCDLCVVSPDRCHYAAGTCREPAWGESFCMQPHRVYLANSSGAKVGLTRKGHEIGRWLDQGAIQGLVILSAPSRRSAGLAEAALARHLSDRTDWRALVREDAAPLDLRALRQRLREAPLKLPDDVCWLEDEEPVALSYPVERYPENIQRFRLDKNPRVEGRLLGIKGQFLLLDGGVINIRQHTSFHVRVTLGSAQAPPGLPPDDDQMELFSA